MKNENFINLGDASTTKLKEISDTSNVTHNTNFSILKSHILTQMEVSDGLNKHAKRKSKGNIKFKNLNYIDLDGLEENINLIRTKYFERPENILKGKEFRDKYQRVLNGRYLDLLLLIKDYPDFNLFDYINSDVNIQQMDSNKSKILRKRSLMQRNNLFLRILIEACHYLNETNERYMSILEDFSFLMPHIETFKNILCEQDKSDLLEIDCEVFFLTVLGFKDKARTLVVKFYDYFKKFIRNFSDSDVQAKTIFESLDIIASKKFEDLTNRELIVIRKMINNIAKRKFYRGLEFLCESELFCFCMTEGRIWRSIIKYIEPARMLKIWEKFYNNIHNKTFQLRSTLPEEYQKRISLLNSEDLKLREEKKDMEKDLSLDFVTNFQLFLATIFRCNRNDIAMDAITHMLDKQRELINLDTFEVCLEYDEDISIELLEKAINSENVRDYHMKVALMKKYFRLACKLLKYKVCKSYLNIPKPKDDNEDYVFIMNKFQLQEKQKLYEALEKKNLEKDKNENHQTFMKLLSMASEDVNEKENETIKEEMNLKEKVENLMDQSPSLRKKFGSIVMNKLDSLAEENEENMVTSPLKRISFQKTMNNVVIEPSEGELELRSSFNKEKSYRGILKKDNNEEFDDRSLFHPDRDKDSDSCADSKKDFDLNKANIVDFTVKKKELSSKLIPEIKVEYANKDESELQGLNQKKNSSLGLLTDSKLNSESNKIKGKYLTSSNSEGKVEDNLVGVKEQDISRMSNMHSFKENLHNTRHNLVFRQLINSSSSVNVQMILIDHLRWGQFTFYCICLLSSISERNLNTEYSEKICKSLLVFTRDEEAISRCRYPLIICVLIAEFLNKLGKLNTKYHYKCQSIAEIFLKLGECLQSSIKEEEMLNYYLREQVDHKKRSALEIIAENRFYNLLDDENVATIVGKLWYGNGRDLSIFKFCRISRIMTANIKHEHYKDLVVSDLKDKVFSFQYAEYTNNCSVRYLVDSVSTIMTTILYQMIIYFYVSESRSSGDPYSNTFFVDLNYIANLVVLSINLNLVMYILYVYLTNRTLKMTVFIFLDIVMFLGVICNFMKLPYKLFQGDEDNIQFLDAIIYSVIIVCAWMRVIGILTTTRSFGPFLRIIYLLLSTVLNFLLVFFGINTVFAQVFTILFRNTNSDFKGFFSSWITLFNSSFGIQNFTNFTIMKVFGYSLLMAYTTLSNIMLLNLVVAIINNLFHFFEKKADAENRAVLVLTYERIKWDEEFGLLILLPAPFNIISIFFSLILIAVKDKDRNNLNVKFSKICYFIIALGNFLILIFTSLLLFPFAYAKSLVHSAYDNIDKFGISTIPYAFFVIVSRPLIFLFYIAEDVKNFWLLCYKDTRENKENKKALINRDVILALRKILFDFRFDKKKKIISKDELYTRLGLNRKGRNENKLRHMITDSSKAGSEFADNLSEIKDVDHSMSSPLPDQMEQTDLSPSNNEHVHSPLDALSNNSNNSPNIGGQETHILSKKTFSNNTEPQNPKVEMNPLSHKQLAFRYLIDKIVDKDKFIDIERTLFILPARVKYTEHFLNSLSYLNMKAVLSGLQKYFFLNAVNNPVYSFKKLQQLIYKILIKFKMIYHFLPENQINQVKTDFKVVNKDEKFSKSLENLMRMEQNDELSDYDDQGAYDEAIKAIETSSNKKLVIPKDVNQSGGDTPSISEENINK